MVEININTEAMNKESKKTMSHIMAIGRCKNLMQNLHKCYGIDFEKPFTCKKFDHILTENTFGKKYGGCKFALLIFVERNKNYPDVSVVPVFKGKFKPNHTPRYGYHPHFYTVGDFESARKTIGKDIPEKRKQSWYDCWVLVPTELGIIKDPYQEDRNLMTMIENHQARVKQWCICRYENNRFAYCFNVEVYGQRICDDTHFHLPFVPDKSGYYPRASNLKRMANEIRLNRSQDKANHTDWIAQVYASEEGIAALKRKAIEMLDMVDSEFDLQGRNAYMDLCGDLFRIASKLNSLRNMIADKTLSSMENTELAFKEIIGTVKKHLSQKQEETAEKVAVL